MQTSKKQQLFWKWMLICPAGLICIGFGLSLFGEAVMLKYTQAGFWTWFSWGTASLVCINAGVSIFGHGLKYRIFYDLESQKENHK